MPADPLLDKPLNYEWLFFTLIVPDDGVQRQISRKFDCGSAELLDSGVYPSRVRFRLYHPIDDMTRQSLEREMALLVPKGTSVAWTGDKVSRECVRSNTTL